MINEYKFLRALMSEGKSLKYIWYLTIDNLESIDYAT